jgi:hypothetical protein
MVTDILGTRVKVGDFVLTNAYGHATEKVVVQVESLKDSNRPHLRGVRVQLPTYGIRDIYSTFTDPVRDKILMFRQTAYFVVVTDQLKTNYEDLPKEVQHELLQLQ